MLDKHSLKPCTAAAPFGVSCVQLLVFADALAQRAAAFPVQKHMAFLGDSEAQKARMPLFALSSVL